MAEKEGVVKVALELLKEVERVLSKKENKYKYSSKKQFVDLAISEKLWREGEKKELKDENSLKKETKLPFMWQEKERRIPTGII